MDGSGVDSQRQAERTGGISGAVAGLVAITPAAGFVQPMAAFAIGLIAGVSCYAMIAKVKATLGYDDLLDAFGVHGAGGRWGRCPTGIFAVSAVNPIFKDAQGNVSASGLLEGNSHQLLNQLAGVAIAWALGDVGGLEAGGCNHRIANCRGGRSARTGSLPTRGRGILLGGVGVEGRGRFSAILTLGQREERRQDLTTL